MVCPAQDLENISVGPSCETVRILWCWCHVGCGADVSALCPVFVFFFFANRPFATDHQSESAWCPARGEESSKPSLTARVRHGRNDAHEALVPVGPEFARVAEQLRLHLAHLLDHVHLRLQLPQVVVGGLLGQNLVEGAKLARAPCARSTQHCRTAPQTWSCTSRTTARRVHRQ